MIPDENQTAHTVQLDRRTLLRGLFLGLGAAATPAWIRNARAAGNELTLPAGPLSKVGPVMNQTLTSGGIVGVNDNLRSPAGFSVRCVARAGVIPVMGSTYPWHSASDGGAVYPAPDGGWVYVSNSESGNPNGGVGALRFAADGTLTSAYPILSRTGGNCAGGSTPWGTWLSCEERAGGQVYECDPFGSPANAVVKPALGAFPHEAACIDPIYNVCYLTEDGGANRFRRFVSNPADLSVMPNGKVRMGLANGVRQRLKIEGIADNTTAAIASIREPRRVSWVDDTGTLGNTFPGGEGIWYYEMPKDLRTVPPQGTKLTRSVIFFSTKSDNRIYALDVENQLLEVIFDNANSQGISNYNVDNVVVSPAGDVVLAEDGSAMRLYVCVPNGTAVLLAEITGSGSELCGPAFTPDGSRLYFASQRGPSGAMGTGTAGAVYEMLIPPQFRSLPIVPFFYNERTGIAPGSIETSENITLSGFTYTLPISIGNGAEYSLDDGPFTSAVGMAMRGQTLRVRHRTPAAYGEVLVSSVTVGGHTATFKTTNATEDRVPNAFDFGLREDCAPGALIESDVITPVGYTDGSAIRPDTGTEYRIDMGRWTTARGVLNPGQSIQLRHTASTKTLEYRRTALRIGGVTGAFVTRTRKL